jgi:IS5 family transposase
MKPKKPSVVTEKQQESSKVELKRIIKRFHRLIKLSTVVNWKYLDQVFGGIYHPKAGRPEINTLLMVSLLYLKHTFNLSNEAVVKGWVENLYWQYMSRITYFEHDKPIESSSMVRWRERMGEAGAEELLKQTVESRLKLKTIRKHQFKKTSVGTTTVKEKAIQYPTEGRLYHRSMGKPVKSTKECEIKLRQSYKRKSRELVFIQSRYIHARQIKRARRYFSKLRIYLGRALWSIQRKIPGQDQELQDLLTIVRSFTTRRGLTMERITGNTSLGVKSV